MPELDTTSTYALIASLVVFTIWLARNASPAVWAKIPERWRWVVPIALAGLSAFAEAYQSGRQWQQALLGAIGAGLAAIGAHHAMQDSPLPYGNAAVLLLVASFGASGCAAAKPYVATVNDAAAILCATAPGTKEQAAARGLSVTDFCALHEVAQPFLDEALRAQRAARSRTLLLERQ